jgi:large subunit ribosomal protein L18
MATGARFFVPFRRRRDGKTDYYKRSKMVVADRPRMVVRKTNRHIIVQLVTAELIGDRTLAAANSGELMKYGYTGSASSTPAAFLTGMLLGVRALNAGCEGAILDIGLNRATPGARVFASLKGAVEAGLDIPHGEEVLPDDGRVRGLHIESYEPDRASGLATNVEQTMDAIMKELE